MTNTSPQNLDDLNTELQLLISRAATLGLSRSFAEIQYASVKCYGKLIDKIPNTTPSTPLRTEGKSKVATPPEQTPEAKPPVHTFTLRSVAERLAIIEARHNSVEHWEREVRMYEQYRLADPINGNRRWQQHVMDAKKELARVRLSQQPTPPLKITK